MSLASNVLIGLGLGVAVGLFFGEQIAFLGLIGRGFVLLLQMAVLPFVAVSLIVGLGGLRPEGARSLFRHAGAFLLLIWAISLALVVASPIAFPDWPAASFFSATLVQEREPFDFVSVYIPSNPFRSLSDGIVPAVVVFSIAFGLALMGSARKAPLLDTLSGVQDALRRLTSSVVRLAPYGIFAIAAEGAGTMAPERLAGVQVYLATYVALSLLLAFWILPGLVAAFTSLSYREALGPARDAVVTAFATGSLFIVLPILAERARMVIDRRGGSEAAERQVDVIVPIAFTLAGAGKLLGLVFVLYAGWQSGFPITPAEYPRFAATGLFSSFAGSAVSIPFMLDLFHVPSDMFQLFLVVDSVIGGRFSALTGSTYAFVLALLGACGAAGWVRLRPRQLAIWGIGGLLLVALTLSAIRYGFRLLDKPYAGYHSFIDRSFLLPTAAWRDREETPPPPDDNRGDTLRRVRARGSLRVGYAEDRLPYAFRNAAGELVGFDVEMAHALARDLGVRVEFFRQPTERMPALLRSGAIDIVMTGLAITPERLERMKFSDAYLEETLAFIVRDYRRQTFSDLQTLLAAPALRLAVPDRGYYAAKIRAFLPDAEIVSVDSPRDFLRAPEGEFDALVFSAEAGSAWTLIYPQFSVAVPRADALRVPVAYATALGDRRMADFIDAWVGLKRNDRTIDRLFAYWFEGEDPQGGQRRWSIAQDVLGWWPEPVDEEQATAPAMPAPAAAPADAATPQPPAGEPEPGMEPESAPEPELAPDSTPEPELEPVVDSAPEADPTAATLPTPETPLPPQSSPSGGGARSAPPP